MAKAKNIVKDSQPMAEKLNKEVDLNEIGKARVQTSVSTPNVIATGSDPSGKSITEFESPMEQSGDRIKTMDILQPFLTKEEVEKIGICKWRLYRTKPDILYTTVINGRRFKLREPEFLDLKDKGRVILVD